MKNVSSRFVLSETARATFNSITDQKGIANLTDCNC
jgi:hypothetical protein